MKNLETDRLTLTMFTTEDAEEFYAYARNPNVGPHAGWSPHKSVEETKEIIEQLFKPVGAWAIRLKNEGKVIGSIGLEPDKYRPDANSRELGYSLSEDYWRQGIMTEAAKEVIRYGFEELGLDQIGICTGTANERSQGVIKKCGFTYEGTIRRTYKIYDGTLRDSMVFSMLREEYETMKKCKEIQDNIIQRTIQKGV